MGLSDPADMLRKSKQSGETFVNLAYFTTDIIRGDGIEKVHEDVR